MSRSKPKPNVATKLDRRAARFEKHLLQMKKEQDQISVLESDDSIEKDEETNALDS